MAEKKKILYIVEAMGGGVFTYIVDLANELVNKYDMYIAYNPHPARAGTQSLDLLFRAGTAGRKAECRKGRNRKTLCCTV